MVEVLIAEPRELSEAQLDAAETLVRNAFGSSFRSHDWLHAVQGVHVTLTDGETLMAFAAVVARTLHHSGVAFDTANDCRPVDVTITDVVAVDPLHT